jgi:4-methyl-5(b-hydroxyethyl)-thiazole monophosphate biosynthesis
MASVLIPLAPGCEELEAITLIDLLRRAQIDVVSAGLTTGPVTCSRGCVIVPDKTLDDALKRDYDMIVLPGGQPGATNLEKDPRIIKLLQTMAQAQKYTAAICAAPKVLAVAGLLKGKRVTAYPGTLENASQTDLHIEQHRGVVTDGKVLTSRGPGTAMDFALELINVLVGQKKRDEVEAGLVRPPEHSMSRASHAK